MMVKKWSALTYLIIEVQIIIPMEQQQEDCGRIEIKSTSYIHNNPHSKVMIFQPEVGSRSSEEVPPTRSAAAALPTQHLNVPHPVDVNLQNRKKKQNIPA